MLTRLKVNGFKNLVGVDLYFGPFTCIAGANAVGKSNLFDAILFLRSLMEMPIMDAAMAVRGDRGATSDIRHLFTQTAKGICLPIEIEAEMLVPGAGSDYLDQPAQAKTTFLVYRVELRYRPAAETAIRPRIELVTETLKSFKRAEAPGHLPFRHSVSWRNSVVKGTRPSPYISTETVEEKPAGGADDSSAAGDLVRLVARIKEKSQEATSGSARLVKLHQDSPT